MVSKHIPCLGQVTQTGCGAICPRYGRGCYGCFGPREQANAASLATWFQAEGHDGERRDDAATAALFSGFTAWAQPFRSVIDDLGGPPEPPDGRVDGDEGKVTDARH